MRDKRGFVTHDFEPLYDEHSRVLILGTIPSPKSREYGFYYGHPQNRFWQVMARVLGEPVPTTIEEKKGLMLKHGIALWDVLQSCEIQGAEDGSIRNPVANDLTPILEQAQIRAIFTTGTKAAALYNRHCKPQIQREAIPLPSTSPANCRYHTLETLTKAYGIIRKYLDEK